MSTKYTYSISTDTTNSAVFTSKLVKEIQDSTITVALDYINTSADDLDIWFKADLSTSEESTLDTIVYDHDGESDEVEEVYDLDGRQMVHATPRNYGTYTYFSGSGDDQSGNESYGYDLLTDSIPESEIMRFDMSGKDSDSKYLDINSINNETYVCEGYCQWKDADNDLVEFKMVPKLTENTSEGTDTNFNLYGGYLIIPAAGDGTLDVSTEDMVLVECVPNEKGDYPAGYWDCEYDSDTKEFDLSTLTANANGTGRYNMFTQEVCLNKFGNCIPLLGSSSQNTKTFDSSRVGHNMRFKVSALTNGDQHNWKFNIMLTMHRKKTC